MANWHSSRRFTRRLSRRLTQRSARRMARRMARRTAVAGVTLCSLAAITWQGAATAVPATQPTTATAATGSGFNLRQPFARESSRRGDADRGTHAIAHVRELQYRLHWAGVLCARPTGYFGRRTQAAVRRYQQREHLRVSGIATHTTWAHLLRDTIRHPHQIPHFCKRSGWHACYDRSMHQVTLWHNGVMRNTWLVRGGASYARTRLGNTVVYYRSKHFYSTEYDSPMPYAQFFDGGEAFHGSVYMTDPFSGHSHGCVNMYIEDARQLWRLTHDKRLHVTVYGHWD